MYLDLFPSVAESLHKPRIFVSDLHKLDVPNSWHICVFYTYLILGTFISILCLLQRQIRSITDVNLSSEKMLFVASVLGS